MPIVIPNPGTPGNAADNYYVRRVDLLLEMGQENFDAEIRLDPSAATADEAIVAEKLAEAGDVIDAEGIKLGLDVLTTGGYAGHVIENDGGTGTAKLVALRVIVFNELRKQGAKYCRARCRALRPADDDEPRANLINVQGVPPANTGADTAGGFTKIQNNARARIVEILTAYRDRLTAQCTASGTAGESLIACGWNDQYKPGNRCPGPLPPGVDRSVVF